MDDNFDAKEWVNTAFRSQKDPVAAKDVSLHICKYAVWPVDSDILAKYDYNYVLCFLFTAICNNLGDETSNVYSGN